MAALSDITLANVKIYFGLPAAADAAKDAKINMMILQAIAWVKSYCRHDFQSAARTSEDVDSITKESTKMFLKYRPVASVTAIREDGVALDADDYCVNKDAGYVERLDGGVWDDTLGTYSVDYTGGQALTEDVSQVIYEIIGIFAGLKVRTYVTGEGVETAVTVTSVPEELKEVLNRHINTVV
jgi:hypothetical protein